MRLRVSMACGAGVLAAGLVAALTVPAQSKPAAAALVAACEAEDGPVEKRIAACTRIIADPAVDKDARAEALVNRGVAHDGAGRHAPAIADFTEALRLSPDDPATLIWRGNAYDALGQKENALADYSEAIRINPGDASGYYNRGTVLESLGKNADAIADYRQALKIDPDYDLAKAGLAGLLKR